MFSGSIEFKILHATDIENGPEDSKIYVHIAVDSVLLFESTVADDGMDPVWNEKFSLHSNIGDELHIMVFSEDRRQDKSMLGDCKLSLTSICGLDPKNYILFTAHRSENVDSKEYLHRIIEAAGKIAKRFTHYQVSQES